MGVVPLVFAEGAGAEIRQAMGIAVFSGMLGVTVFGLVLTPVFYFVIGSLVGTDHAAAPGPGRAACRRPRGGGVIMRRSTFQLAFLGVGLLLMALLALGCATRPPYSAPAAKPVALTQAQAPAFAPQPYDPRWWQLFQDPVLDRLEAAALAGNLDIRQAVARVDQARAIFRDVELDQFPVATVGASVDVREQAIPGFTSEPIRTNTYRAGLVAFWELDLFGGIRSAVQSARAERAGPRGVARGRARGGGRRGGAQLLPAARAAAAAGRGRAQPDQPAGGAAVDGRAARRRRGGGAGRGQRGGQRGRRRGERSAAAPGAGDSTSPAGGAARCPAGRPGRGPGAAVLRTPDDDAADRHGEDLLRRRPDVRAAERQLAAAAAREGIAAADLYPRVSISGVLGFLAGRGNVFSLTQSRQWAVSPAVSWVGTDLGSARARLRATEAATRGGPGALRADRAARH